MLVTKAETQCINIGCHYRWDSNTPSCHYSVLNHQFSFYAKFVIACQCEGTTGITHCIHTVVKVHGKSLKIFMHNFLKMLLIGEVH